MGPSYLEHVQRVLFEEEQVMFSARQRRVGPGGSILDPSIIVATNERLLLIKDVLSLHLREDIDAVPYANITYVKLEHGLISSALLIGVLAYGQATEYPSGTMTVEGLRYKDALELQQLIDKMIIKLKGKSATETVTEMPPRMATSKEKWKVLCKRCGVMNDFQAHYCSNCGATL
jgi:late competence protein required for DNA uptake (superfamily II DNA/RNA helicase)